MSGGIGSIGSAGNIGMSQVSPTAQNNRDMAMLSIQKKKHHGEDGSFDAMLNSLNVKNAQNNQKVHGGQAVSTGMHVNKFA